VHSPEEHVNTTAVLIPFGWESDRSMQAVPVSINKTEDTRPAAFEKRASRRGNGACQVQHDDFEELQLQQCRFRWQRCCLTRKQCGNIASGRPLDATEAILRFNFRVCEKLVLSILWLRIIMADWLRLIQAAFCSRLCSTLLLHDLWLFSYIYIYM
jgi:hypothetical protein